MYAHLYALLQLVAAPNTRPSSTDGRLADDRGQATTEYALVLLAAALVALLVVAWATSGSGAAKIGQLFDSVLNSVLGRV
jgi:Flp pilus assembly pilin Flp